MLLALPWPAHLARAPSLLTLVICCSACGRPSSLFSPASCGAAPVHFRWWRASKLFLCCCFQVFSRMGLVLVARQGIRKIGFCVHSLLLLLLIGVVLALTLVTLVVTRRYYMLQCLVSKLNHIALTNLEHSQSSAALLLSSTLSSCLHPAKRKHNFSMISGSATRVS